VVSLQCGSSITTSQALFAITLAKLFELLDGKVPTTGVPRSPPFAKVVGLGLPDFFGITLCPLLATNFYFVAVALVVLTFRIAYTIFVFCCPSFLVLGCLFLVLFLVLSACLDPMG